jgi:hypothetical protein
MTMTRCDAIAAGSLGEARVRPVNRREFRYAAVTP